MNDLEMYLKEVREIMKYCIIMVRLFGLEKSIEFLKMADEVIKEELKKSEKNE